MRVGEKNPSFLPSSYQKGSVQNNEYNFVENLPALTLFGGLGGPRFTVGLDGLKDLFQPK